MMHPSHWTLVAMEAVVVVVIAVTVVTMSTFVSLE